MSRKTLNYSALVLNVHRDRPPVSPVRLSAVEARLHFPQICKSRAVPSSLLVCLGMRGASAAAALVLSSFSRRSFLDRSFKGVAWKSLPRLRLPKGNWEFCFRALAL